VLNVSGELALDGDNILSFYNIIHCAERIHLARFASASEFCTMVDSRHIHDGDSEYFYENVETAPIDIGRNVWLATKASVLMGTTIGDDALVASHAVVRGEVPARAMVGGIPAKVIRQR
jgi:acetyltransferase-like isoleucine patch superfamily enzyme